MILKINIFLLWWSFLWMPCHAIGLDWFWKARHLNNPTLNSNVQIIPDDAWDTIASFSDKKDRDVIQLLSTRTRQAVNQVSYNEAVDTFLDHAFVMQGMMQCIRQVNSFCLQYGLSILEKRTIQEWQVHPLNIPPGVEFGNDSFEKLIRWRIKELVIMILTDYTDSRGSQLYMPPTLKHKNTLLSLILKDKRYQMDKVDFLDVIEFATLTSSQVKILLQYVDESLQETMNAYINEQKVINYKYNSNMSQLRPQRTFFNRRTLLANQRFQISGNEKYGEYNAMNISVMNQLPLIIHSYDDLYDWDQQNLNGLLYWAFRNGLPFSTIRSGIYRGPI